MRRFGSRWNYRAYHSTVDDLTIVIGDANTPTNVNNPAGSGISANPTSGDITIDSSVGSVSGSFYGIGVTNNGTGAISVTSADVMGGSSSGILASGSGTNLSVDSSLGAVIGANGIAVVNLGSGSTNTDTIGISMRVTLDGSGGNRWPVQPFISVGCDNFSQDGTTLVGQGVTDLVINDVDLDRYTVGYGLRADQQWDRSAMHLGVAGYHYAGDTRSVLTSRFFGAGAGGASFNTFGFNIQDQFQIDVGLSQKVGDGWQLSLDGYVEFGDLESYGGMFKVSKKF